MIDNPAAPRVKRAAQLKRKKQRVALGRFLVEGPHAVAEALIHAPDTVETVYATPAALTAHPNLDRLADRCGARVELATDAVLAQLADTVTPQGVVAVARVPDCDLAGVLADARLVAVLHEVRDAGNAGTVIRGADAAGADAVLITGDSVDPWHPKTVRATAGSLFHLPVAQLPALPEALTALDAAGFATVAADLSGSELGPDEPLLAGRVAWVFGNEARGLAAEDAELCRARRRLPIYGAAESLNLATAAAVCLYTTAFQQRR